MRNKAIVLPLALALMLAFATVFGISTKSYADEGISTDQGMSETISDNGSEEDSGNGGDAGPVDDEEEQGEPAWELPELAPDVEDRQKQILIGSAQELCDLAEAVNNGSFVQTYDTAISNAVISLTNDIDLSSFQTGGGFEPIGNAKHAFKGEFDGNGFTISNITINREEDPCLGLFGILGKGAYVHDIKLTGAKISGLALVGGIAGIAELAEIKNCSVEGDIFASDSLAGGIAGGAIESKIDGCVTSGSVTAEIENAGGIAGQAGFYNGLISNCSSSMVVTVPWGAGGIAGSVINADVVGGGFSGELVCQSEAAGSMVGDIADVETSSAEVEPIYETDNDTNDMDASDGSSPSMPIDMPRREPDNEPGQPGEAESDETGVSTDVM